MPKSRRRRRPVRRHARTPAPRRIDSAHADVVVPDAEPAQATIPPYHPTVFYTPDPTPDPDRPAWAGPTSAMRIIEPAPNPIPDSVSPSDGLSREEAEVLAKQDLCSHCGGLHARACPRVRKLKFHSSGAAAEIEFWADGKWSTDGVIWPETIAAALAD